MERPFVSEQVPSHRQPAPGDLEVIRAFINTLDVEDGEDQLDTPQALVAWLAGRELLAPGTKATRADLGRALELREAFREILLGHHGGYEVDPAALEALQRASERARVEVRFGADGIARAEPVRPGVE